MLSQHAGLLPTDPLLLQQHPQIPVSISTSQGNLGIATGAIHLDNSQNLTNHQHQSDNMSSQNQNQMSRDMRVTESVQIYPKV